VADATLPAPDAGPGDPGGRSGATILPPLRLVLVGNPNAGKTTLFNRLCGLRHKVSNFPGTTQEGGVGALRLDDDSTPVEVVDLPGVYSLALDAPEAEVCRATLDGKIAPGGVRAAPPDAALIVVDASNLPRNLTFAGEILSRGIPSVVALTKTVEAKKRGVSVDVERLRAELNCPVVVISTRAAEEIDALRAELARTLRTRQTSGLTPVAVYGERRAWAERIANVVTTRVPVAEGSRASERADFVLTHPWLGLVAFAIVMATVFYMIFRVAAFPMDWIDEAFASIGSLLDARLPEGALRELAGGVVAGVGATVVFLPQICLLFFLISLLEESGFLARAALMTDRWLRPFGLSGHAFVPLLSAHACALPAISATRGIPDKRDRLAAILAAPFMSCSARIPVYVLLTVLLFPDSPLKQSIAFGACYLIGIGAGLLSSMIARRALMPGRSRDMVIELPSYTIPSVPHALRIAGLRGVDFLRKAGTLILAVSIVLWWLGSYPTSGPSPQGEALRAQATSIVGTDPAQAESLELEAERVDTSYAAQRTALGRVGSFIQPVFAPLGYDRQLTIAVLASFAAREVFVSTMAVQVAGVEELEDDGLVDAMANATRDDGSPVFTPPVAWSLLIFYVLAMQCLPTVALAAREAGHWKWAALQLAWMSSLAYVSALVVFQTLSATLG
jgi:ferrous iron transport protein B